VTTTPDPPEAVFLTSRGRDHLEARLAELVAQRARLTRRRDEDPTDVQDPVDESSRLQERDEQSQLEDRIADLRALLDVAQPVPRTTSRAVALGALVRVRDAAGEETGYRLVDKAEVGTTPDDVADDSPLGRALLGRVAGDAVSVVTPDGVSPLTVVAVTPYAEDSA
jgi:transcription elongation GreA/GreB family factor